MTMEIQNTDLYREIGLRCMRARSAKGWSQQKLAEMLSVTPQAISKYETKGIADIVTIHKLSEILGCNLEEDEKDVEGHLGEVGKEILAALIKNNGYLDFKRLVAVYLCGMKEETASREISKLSNMGMCVREAYTDLGDHDCDGVFITAKGVISLKNNSTAIMAEEVSECVSDTVVYERRIHNAASYQEYLNSRAWEKIIRKLRINSSYRVGYIVWLKKNFITKDLLGTHTKFEFDSDIDDRTMMRHECLDKGFLPEDTYVENDRYYYRLRPDEEYELVLPPVEEEPLAIDQLVPGISLQYDLFYQMTMGMTDEELSAEIDQFKKLVLVYEKKWNELLGASQTNTVDERTLNQKAFKEHFHELCEYADIIQNRLRKGSGGKYIKHNYSGNEEENNEVGEINTTWYKGPAKEAYIKLKELCKKIDDEKSLISEDLQNDIQMICRWSNYLSMQYKPEETERFIDENYRTAESDEEKKIDKELAKLNKACPASLKYYYPEELYTDYRIGERIRVIYGITPRRYTKEELEKLEEYRRSEEEIKHLEAELEGKTKEEKLVIIDQFQKKHLKEK